LTISQNAKCLSVSSVEEVEEGGEVRMEVSFGGVPLRGDEQRGDGDGSPRRPLERDLETENELLLDSFHVATLRQLIQVRFGRVTTKSAE
jgi:hypothetical protein